MNPYYLDKAKTLKMEGNSYEKIRNYLSNSGVSDEEISSIFRFLDNEEIDLLYRKQKLASARNQLIGSLLIFCLGFGFNIYRLGNEESLDILSLLIPSSILIGFYANYKKIKTKTFSAYQIIQEERRGKKDR